jgi:GntR family transcriptional repressor for pyruvate dehydrogenase complex
MTQTGAVDRTLAEHGAILDAIAMHDGELARSLTVAHIRGVEQWLARSADSAIV